MTRTIATLLAAAAFVVPMAPPAAAQDTHAPTQRVTDDDIVVTGRAPEPPTRREINRQAREISRARDVYDQPLARIEHKLCPGVLGIPAQYATLVIDRLRFNAERLEVPLTRDDGTCRPNFVVAFVRDGQAQIAELEREHGYLFDSLSLPERRELVAEDGPARVWSVTETRTRDGMPVPRADGLANPPVANMWMAHSKIYTAVREDIVWVLVVFDLEQIRGKTLVQLADYATMRGFAETREAEGELAADTILGLFAGDGPKPAEMTDFDLAYLRSVYKWIPNLPAAAKLGGVGRELARMQREAEQEPEAAE